MASLEALLPREKQPIPDDVVLDRFVSYLSGEGITLYSHQDEAILELLAGKHVVLATPTGSGKSLVATAFHFLAMSRGDRSFYTCPVKALVNEKFFALCNLFGATNVGMMTGDAAINASAPIICCTAEILSSLAVRESKDLPRAVVMDEFHYYGDRDRGVAWQLPLLAMPETQFLLMSATLGDVKAIAESLVEVTGREVAEVRSAERPVPLEMSYAETPVHETIAQLLKTQKSPIYLVNFSQRAAAEQAQNLLSADVCTKAEKQQLRAALEGLRWPTPFGKDLRKLLNHGIGIHHAGMLPRYRRLVERLSQRGFLKVVSGTDTLGVGVNIPIRTVLFTQLCKFDGEKTLTLPVRDFLQIAGRAGRKGFDDRGWVIAQAPPHVIENAHLAKKKAAGKRKVNFVKPPTRGYVHWDKSTFDRLCHSPPERLESRFTVTHGLLISLVQAHPRTGYRRLVQFIERSHNHGASKRRLLIRARALFRALVDSKLLHVSRRSEGREPAVGVSPDLQREFSLHHTLSLFVLDVLPKLELGAPEYEFDVLSVVESILEDPAVVLRAQADVVRNRRFQELKSQGVAFETRVAEVGKITWPKPNAEFIYAAFDAFAERYPWLQHENIHPKGVAREIYETGQTFNEFIREYRLQRCEGLVLRYLAEVYKAIGQNVPEAVKTDALEEIAEYVFTLVKSTDSSLLDEWEALQREQPENLSLATPTLEPVQPAPGRQERKRRLKDFGTKALQARLRAELHQLARLIAARSWEEAAEAIAIDDEFTEASLESTLAPYFAQFGALDLTPRARQPIHTNIDMRDPMQWRVRHNLLDADGNSDWCIEGIVDLGRDARDPGPLLRVQRIGA